MHAQTITAAPRAEDRLVRRSEMVSCDVAFIDCRIEGSSPKQNYSIIGAGVTQSDDQVVNIVEPHGFAVGAAAMPNGVTNNLHIHYTAEVFMIFRGEWLFRWGADGKDGEIIGREGDIISVPTWIFRGFTNIGPDDGWIYTALGQDDTGGVIWHPSILATAATQGLYLGRDNMLVDLAAGDEKPADDALIEPIDAATIATLRRYSVAEVLARVTRADERRFSDRSLLQAVLPGHRASLAPAIGFGMTQDRDAAPKVTNPHGFSVEWLRIEPGQRVGPFRLDRKQVAIVKSGRVRFALAPDPASTATTAEAGPWDVFSAPADGWRTLEALDGDAAELVLVTAGDGRAIVTWDDATVAAAAAAGLGLDPNRYIAPVRWLPAMAG